MLPRSWLFLCVAALLVCPVAADEAPRYNLVRLQAQESESVSNDTMHVTLTASGERRDAAELASQVNADMAWALDLAKRHAGVKVSTGNYRTWQVRQDNKMKGWQARQDLMLESRDTRALSQLTGLLQEKLQVDSMRFSVSAETRTAVENRLIELALRPSRCAPGSSVTSCRQAVTALSTSMSGPSHNSRPWFTAPGVRSWRWSPICPLQPRVARATSR
jgi:predicted secreted protein